MKNVKNILKSIGLVGVFFLAIVLINHFTDKAGMLQGEYEPLWYIVPIMAALAAFLIFKTQD